MNKEERAYAKKAKKAHHQRQVTQERYNKFNIEPSEVDGITVSSRLEALWLQEFKNCPSFQCFECVKVPVWVIGIYGPMLSNYKPDFLFETATGDRVLVELKPTHELAMTDDRQKRALELNPKMKFAVIGGYPYDKKITVRMMTGDKEIVHRNVPLSAILDLLGCGF